MSHLWVIETLADLRAYAAGHGLSALADHLETAIELAHLEIANSGLEEGKAPSPNTEGGQT